MNNTGLTATIPSDGTVWHANGDTIANVVIGVINISIAIAQLVLGYMAYRASRSKYTVRPTIQEQRE